MQESKARREFLKGIVTGSLVTPGTNLTAAQATPPAGRLNVRELGARGNGEQLDTVAIQRAIDQVAQAGGGTVYLPPGRYLCGTLELRDNVFLYLEAGAVLLGSRRLVDYPSRIPQFRSYTDHYTERSLIYAEGRQNVGITGQGMLDGQGAAFQGEYKVRPYMIRMIQCRRVLISGVRIENSPMWVQHYLACDDVRVEGIQVSSHANLNNDGLDIDCCQRVVIAGCNITSGDDAIVLKSTADRPTRDVAITNCILSSRSNAFKLGTESNGGFQNIVLSNCAMYETRLSGIAIETVDGGASFDIVVNNVTMRSVQNPIFVRLGNRARPFVEGGPRPGVGTLRRISISNVRADGASPVGCAIAGIPGHPVEDVTLDNIWIRAAGGVPPEKVPKEVPEREAAYPEHKMFGLLPAYGFYVRHVRGLRMSNVELAYLEPDARPPLVLEDVQGVLLSGLRLQAQSTAVRMKQVKDVLLTSSSLATPVETFLEVDPASATEVSLLGNDFSRARTTARGGKAYQSGNRARRQSR